MVRSKSAQVSEASAIAFGPELQPMAAGRGQIVVTTFRACEYLARPSPMRDRAAKRTTVNASQALNEYLQETIWIALVRSLS